MTNVTVAVIQGDGIGPEVTASALAVLQAVSFEAEFIHAQAGLACFKQHGTPLPEATLEAAKAADAVLFGAITTPPEAQDYPSVILELRRALGLFANLRPVTTFPGVGRFGDTPVDILVVRENTEGIYIQRGWQASDRAYNLMRRSKRACRRVLKLAFEQAMQRSGRLVVAHKANVVKPADVYWVELAKATAAEFEVDCSLEIVDALCTKLILQPSTFDVIVAPNLYGDILSDVLAGVAGSLGLCASANLGASHALFEPVHGSAPDIAGQGIANPIGAILSAALLLKHLGHKAKSVAIEKAVEKVLADKIFPPDLGGNASTLDVTQAVINNL